MHSQGLPFGTAPCRPGAMSSRGHVLPSGDGSREGRLRAGGGAGSQHRSRTRRVQSGSSSPGTFYLPGTKLHGAGLVVTDHQSLCLILQTYLISASDEGGLHGGCSGSLAGTPPGPVRQDTLPRCSSGLWGSNESCAPPPPPPHAQLRPQRCAQTPADRPWDSRAPASAGRMSCAVVEKVGIQSLNMLWSVIS